MSVNSSAIEEAVQKTVEELTFRWIDYSFFGMMLGVSGIVGIYFGFFSKKLETTTEYLLGGKTMGYFPVAMSITASHVTGITLLGVPSEVYQFGTQYVACIVTTIFTGLLTAYIFLPVFYKLQLTSTFEYLEIRFARSVRQFASLLYTISLILQLPIVVYVPAVAFSQVTGLNLHYITILICILCIFYTTVGGLKAVVWTDTIQFIITVFAMSFVLTLGMKSVGGFGEIWRISEEGGRLIFFNMDPSPFARFTFWGVTIGMTTSWASGLSVNQGCMQRFLAVPTISDARKSIFITCIGIIVVKCLSIFSGLVMYAKYHGCDPISTNAVTTPDQLLPYYMMDVARNIPGLPGLFLAALVSASLSTMSGGLNTASGTIWEDFISPWVPESDTKEKTATRIMKITVVVLGVLCGALVFVVEQIGEVFAMSVSMTGVTAGTIVGLFTLGVLIPWATYKGAVIGGVLGFVTSSWIIVGAQFHKIKGNIRYEELPTSTVNCSYPLNMTEWTKPTVKPEDEPMILFTISFLYYAFIGAVAVISCGAITSYFTGALDLKDLNRDHFSPVVHGFLPRTIYTEVLPMAAIPVKASRLDKSKAMM